MKLLYFPDLPGLNSFGIQIPVHDTRAKKTLEELRKHPDIGPRLDGLLTNKCMEIISLEDIARAHSEAYVHSLYSEKREQLLVEAYELLDAEGNYNRYDPSLAKKPLTAIFDVQLERVAGSLQAMRTALTEGACFHFAGGFHHAHAAFGHGFCFVNDIVIGIRRLQHEQAVHRVWVIDTDAHKGDGTAAITVSDPSIATLSIHMAKGWPLDYPEFDQAGRRHPSFTPSTVDIPIEEGQEMDYCGMLARGLDVLNQSLPKPDLAVIVYGADPYEYDELESARPLKLSLARLKQRDKLVYRFLNDAHIPAAYLMAGGYGPRAWEVYYQFLEWVLSL